jgi:hypothetical protein
MFSMFRLVLVFVMTASIVLPKKPQMCDAETQTSWEEPPQVPKGIVARVSSLIF